MKFKDVTKPTRTAEIKREWHVIDLNGQILGRISTNIATLLIGKKKPYYAQNIDCGDYVVLINAKKIKVTGNKAKQKTYDAYSGYPGGRKAHTYEEVMESNPKRIIEESIKGMLPKNKLRDTMMNRLYVYADENHPYGAKVKKG